MAAVMMSPPQLSSSVMATPSETQSRQYHQSVDPQLLGVGGEPASQGCATLGDSRKDGNLSPDLLASGSQDLQLFGIFESTVFPDRPQHNQAVDASPQQSFDMLGRGVEIEGLIVVELGRHGGIDAAPVCLVV
jgi:hypothetical protein